MRKIFFIAIPLFIIIFLANVFNSTNTTVYNNVKIIDKQQQMIVKETTTEYRYLVITDKGTFICESNIFQGKFNNSDIFWRIQKDSTYSNVTVSGIGKSFLFDYQNIININ
jgi:hypothetical protein